jgi:diguanylate cyclase (GGDEF)-like protein
MARRWWYGATAVVLAGGAPLGLAVTRLARRGRGRWEWALADVRAEADTYLYVAISTALVFGAFGYVLGAQADRLVERSNRDSLTGLGNWRLIQERLRLELGRVMRYGEPLSLLLLDLDGLKRINDLHGHAAGTAALVWMAEVLRQEARATDTAARWGGDEFALLAPSTPLDAGASLAERLRVRMEAGPPDREGVCFTVSAGVACAEAPVGDPGRTASRLWDAADAALYRAKREGRNRVRCASAVTG